MASGSTPLRGRPYPLESDTPDAAADMHLLATSVDTAPVVGQGALASRPAASAAGNRYYVTGDGTAANNGIEWLDTGSSWVQVSQVPPIGSITQYAGSGDPSDTHWLVCDGRAISRTTYAALFALLASTYGGGDGSTTFNIPDLRGRVPVGVDTTGAHLGSARPALASSGGEEQHTLVNAELPVNAPIGSAGRFSLLAGPGYASGANALTAVVEATNGLTAGSGSAHNNLQPYLAVNHIIRVQ